MTYTLGDALRQMALTQVPRLGDWNLDRLAEMADELQRVNDDLENQIHEDGGFIDRLVVQEEEIGNLKDVLRQARNLIVYLSAEHDRLQALVGETDD